MKVFGWICTIIGSLAFIGAAIYGHSVFGPVFFLDSIRYCTIVKIQEENLTHSLLIKHDDSKNE